MPRCDVVSINAAKGRFRSRLYKAPTIELAAKSAKTDGATVDYVMPNGLASIDFTLFRLVRRQRLAIPSSVSDDEIADLTCLAVMRDVPAPLTLQRIAINYDIVVTKYSGKRLLFQKIFEQLRMPGNEQDLVAWFVYCVYLDLIRHMAETAVDDPDDPLISVVARRLVSQPPVIESIRRYVGTDLISFNAKTHAGRVRGGRKTIAYRVAANILKPFAEMELMKMPGYRPSGAIRQRLVQRFGSMKKRLSSRFL